MSRGRAESIRLTHQHFLWKDLFGWNLHPYVIDSWREEDATQHKKSLRKIADVACGNCIWTMDESRSSIHPSDSTTFVGFDISGANFTPPGMLPANITLEVWDIRDPPPEKYRSSFDLVCVRLMVMAVQAGNTLPIIENLKLFLKPGGWLQWGEIDLAFLPMKDTVSDDSKWWGFLPFWMRVYDPQYDVRWTHDLTVDFEKAGLQETSICAGGMPRAEMRKFWTDNDMGALQDIVQIVSSRMPEGAVKSRILESWAAIERELAESRSMPHFENRWFLGRKQAA